jgi:pyochelin biosynthetic protein PchC
MPPRMLPWSEPWLWELRPASGTVPDRPAATVLFLPHAGGSATTFGGWAAALPGPVRTLAAQYPGRGPRFGEPAATELADLVQPLAAALAPLAGPLILVGHSMGAIVGFELAWLLQQRGRTPRGLLASAARPPGAPTLFGNQPKLPPNRELIDLLRRTGGLPAAVLASPDMLSLVLDPVRADLTLIERYDFGAVERRLRCPIVAVGGRDDPLVPPALLDRWRDRGSATVTVHHLDGDHFYFADQLPTVAALVDGLLPAEAR